MPQFVGETPVYAREVGLTQKFAKVASGNGVGQIEYQGFAYPGTASSTSGWAIRKFTYDSASFCTDMQWAGGSDALTNIWDNRSVLSYS